MKQLTAEEKLIKGRIQLGKQSPFFSYLVMYLDFIEEERVGSCGVDGLGSLYYNSEFIHSLSEKEVKGVLCHEVMHIALEHMGRVGGREKQLSNIAQDLVINDILLTDGMSLPKAVLIPQNHTFSFPDLSGKEHTIDNIDEKCWEQIYAELKKFADKVRKELLKQLEKMEGSDVMYSNDEGSGKGDKKKNSKKGCIGLGGEGKQGKQAKGKGTKPQSSGAKKKKKNWKKILSEAHTHAKMQGNIPAGIDRLVEEILDSKVRWREVLYKFITNELPHDYSYSRPSRRSRATGIYMPHMTKESIDVVIAVDTSGSIGQKELSQFLGEIISIAKSFENISMTLVVCDCKIQNVLEVRNGSIEKIRNLKMTGGGGTSHLPVFKWIEDNKPNSKVCVCFTDGYTDFPKEAPYGLKTLWVIPEEYKGIEKNIPFGEVIVS